jgi:hypothetical protein
MMLERTVERRSVSLARKTSRRSFLGWLGRGFVALAGGQVAAIALNPERAEAYHICGHTFTTGSCPHPYYPLTRIDLHGYPVHPVYGYPIDNEGKIYTSREQRRTKICAQWVPSRYPFTGSPVLQGAWYRCCSGRIRKLWDCCSYSKRRINGDASLHGYCYGSRRVFCVTYFDTNTRC